MPAWRKHAEAIREEIEREYAERLSHVLSREPCPYCRKVRVEDSRGLCRECGAPAGVDAEDQDHDRLATATLVVAGYRIGQY